MPRIGELVDPDLPKVNLPITRSSVINLFITHRLPVLPVVDKKANLLGVLSVDALLNEPDEEQVSVLLEESESRVLENLNLDLVAKPLVEKGYVCVEDDHGFFKGIVFVRDVLRKVLSKKEFDKISVARFIRKMFPLIWDKTPMRLAWQMLKFCNYSSALVINDEMNLFSVLTKLDFLENINEERMSSKEEVGVAGAGEEWGVEGSQIVYIDKLVLSIAKTPLERVLRPLQQAVLPSETIASLSMKMCLARTELFPVIDSSKSLVGAVFGSDLLSLVSENTFQTV
jgi:predicted transcriptional regulator